ATSKSKVYGAALPALTFSVAGFVNGDTAASLTTAPVLSTTATANTAVGSYPILASGAVDNNYNIVYVSGSPAITRATLTVTATNQSMHAGAFVPPLQASYSGFVNGDTVASLTTLPMLTTPATSSSSASTYTIFVSGAVDANYLIVNVNGVLIVT